MHSGGELPSPTVRVQVMSTLTRMAQYRTPTQTTVPVSRTRPHPWTWMALAGYLGVVIALTCLKAWFAIGLLWKPENQRVREVQLNPFSIITGASTPFNAAFDILGNVALFVPLGLLLMTVTRRAGTSVAVAAGLSLVIEISQYLFAVGRTDITDLICNTAGAITGVLLAGLFLRQSPQVARGWTVAATVTVLLAVVSFAILVVIGPSLVGEVIPVDEGPLR